MKTPTESYRFEIIDMSALPEKPKLKFKDYKIWVGYHHLGQGDTPFNEPQLLGTVRATSFKIACVIYEHQLAIDSLTERMMRDDMYIEDIHFGDWNYKVKTNSNSWLGRYFETRKEALTTF